MKPQSKLVGIEPDHLDHVVGGARSVRTSAKASPQLTALLTQVTNSVKDLAQIKADAAASSSSQMLPMMMGMMRR